MKALFENIKMGEMKIKNAAKKKKSKQNSRIETGLVKMQYLHVQWQGWGVNSSNWEHFAQEKYVCFSGHWRKSIRAFELLLNYFLDLKIIWPAPDSNLFSYFFNVVVSVIVAIS